MTTHTVTLNTPVTSPAHGIPVSEITLRPLKVRDLVQVNRDGGDDFERTINLLSASASLPRDVIDEIEISDLTALSEALGGILGKSVSPESGRPS